MQPPRIPSDDESRLTALRSTRALDTPPEAAFDDIVRVAAALCGAPIALVSLVDAHRQWFKARVGMPVPETSREVSFCAHAIHGDAPMVVRDARLDARFADNPLVTADPNIRFYAGVPLRVDEGSAIGTLCVIDRVPRDLSNAQLDGLRALASHVAAELRRRRATSTSARAEGMPVAEGDVVGGYRVGELIGRGGLGVVMGGLGPGGEPVAIKFLTPSVVGSAECVERFVREARLQLRLASPHIARVLDVGDVNGAPYIVMERLKGADLATVLLRRGALPPGEAVGWARQACEALADAHALGVIHRDLKPANLFLAQMPEGTTLKVLDFGVAKDDLWRRRDRLTAEGATIGTPHYMPPEQFVDASSIDARADVWSLGAVLYELLTDRAPFGGRSSFEVCAAVLSRDPEPPRSLAPEVPAALDRVVMRCLAKQRDRRPADMRTLSREIAEAMRATA